MAEPTLDELTRFQAALLELLSKRLPLEQMMARLGSEPAFQPFAEAVRQYEPRMVRLASELVEKWGRGGSAEL